MSRRVWAAGRVAIAMACLLAITTCARNTLIERTDWGAIPRDATIRVTTLDGTQRILNEVVVLPDALEGVDTEAATNFRIPLDSIEYLENRAGPSLGPVLVAIAAGITAIAIINASGRSDVRPAPTPTPTSCPFLYSFNGRDYVFDSETYAGAITRGLERTDVDNLDHLRPVDGTYRLLLTNERPETEYTDELSLLVLDRPAGSLTYPDSRGAPRLLEEVETAASAVGLRGGDFVAELEAADGRVWVGDPVATADLSVDSELRDGVILTFPKPEADHALMAVHAQNTELAPLALQMFLELQGSELVQWYRQVDHDPSMQARLQGWVLREGTLAVSVWVDGEWQLQDALLDVGPLLPKTQIAELDFSGVTADEVRIKLESARGLWTLDWVALGREVEAEPVLTPLTPSLARDARGRDLTAVLAGADGAYYTALEGDRVELEFQVPPGPPEGWERNVFARSTGFYHVQTSLEGPVRADVADRILNEPLYGNRYLLGLLRLSSALGVGVGP